jgi:DNA polymerase elongation subunit (family B)
MMIVHVRALDWYVNDEKESEEVTIYLTGLSDEPVEPSNPLLKRKVFVKIDGFCPYCYVELPNIKWTHYQIEEIKYIISGKCWPKGPVSISDVVYKKRLYNYQPVEVSIPYIMVHLQTKQDCTNLSFRLDKPIDVSDVGKVQLKVHEQDITSLIKFTAVNELSLSGWIDVKITDKSTLFRDGSLIQGPKIRSFGKDGMTKFDAEPLTTCHTEVWSDWRSVVPGEDHGLVHPTVLSFDLECYSSRHITQPQAMPSSTIPADKIIQAIMVFQIPGQGVKKILISLISESGGKCLPIKGVKVYNVSTEALLLEMFTRLVNRYKVDLLTGYNIMKFDIPYLWNRAEYCRCMLKFRRLSQMEHFACDLRNFQYTKGEEGKVKSTYHDSTYIVMPTRITFDLMGLIKRDFHLPRYKLDDIALKVLKEGKVDLPPKELFERWDSGTDEDITEIGVYCVQDGVLVLDIFNKLNAWIALVEMSEVGKVPIEDIFMRGQGIKNLCQLYREIRDDNRVKDYVKNKKHGTPDKKEKYTGAIVLDPTPGMYKDVPVLDFAGLYPSIMIWKNICFTTIVRNESISDDECNVIEWPEHINCSHDPDRHKNRKKALSCGIKRHRFYKSPMGLVPRMLTHILEARGRVKTMMKTAKDENEYNVLNGRQLALKISANSVYGNLGNRLGYLPLPEGAEAVTATGRMMINQCVEYIERKYDAKVVYGDSVAGYTPVVLKVKGQVEMSTFECLGRMYGDGWIPGEDGKEVCELNDVYAWSSTGWTEVKRVVRHTLSSHKKMIRVYTYNGIVDVTDDHSLILENGSTVSPKDLNLDQEPHLLQRDIEIDHPEVTPGIVKSILWMSRQTKTDFLESLPGTRQITSDCWCTAPRQGQSAAMSIYILCKSLGYTVSISGASDMYTITYSHDAPNRSSSQVYRLEEIPYSGYVYDLATENHQFQAGIGNIIVHNTDSVFIVTQSVKGLITESKKLVTRRRPGTIPEIIRLSWQIANEITKKIFQPPVKLEYEKTFKDIIVFKKKNYAGTQVDDKGTEFGIMYKGIAVVRNDRPPILRNRYKLSIDDILHGAGIGTIVDILVPVMHALMCGRVRLEDLVISKSVGNPADYKKKDSHAHVVMAEIMISRGIDFKPGDKVQYVLLDVHSKNAKQKDMVEDPEYIKIHPELDINYTYYITNQIIKTFNELTGLAYGCKLATILYEGLQMRKRMMSEMMSEVTGVRVKPRRVRLIE